MGGTVDESSIRHLATRQERFRDGWMGIESMADGQAG
jgi:hypothetical protein